GGAVPFVELLLVVPQAAPVRMVVPGQEHAGQAMRVVVPLTDGDLDVGVRGGAGSGGPLQPGFVRGLWLGRRGGPDGFRCGRDEGGGVIGRGRRAPRRLADSRGRVYYH